MADDVARQRPAKIRRRGYHRRAPGPVYSEGARLFWGALDQHKLKTEEVAERVGVAKNATVLRWLYGDRVPDRAFALAIQRQFGIDPSLWDVKPEGKHALELPTSQIAA